MNGPHCAAPVAWATLVDYWAGDLAEADASAVEEHLFACERCSRELDAVAALADGVRDVSRGQGVHGGLAPVLLERLERDGRVLRRYRASAGGEIHCGVGIDDDLVVLELSADLAGLSRVDFLYCAADGTVIKRAVDVPVVAGREVVWAEPADLIRTIPTSRYLVRLVAVEDPEERIVAEYTLHHTH